MTTTQISVRSFCADAVTDEHWTALASLPMTFQCVRDGSADVALVGSDQASIDAGLAIRPRALVLAAPALLSMAQIDRVRRSTTPVFPFLKLAEVVEQSRSAIPSDATLVRVRLLSNSDPHSAWLEQLTALQVFLGPLTEIALLSELTRTYSGTARTPAGVPVLWSGQTGAEAELFDLDVIGLVQRLEFTSVPGGTARPAQVRVGTAAGLQTNRGIYQSGALLFWRSIAAELTGTATGTPRLSDIVPLLTFIGGLATDRSVDHAQKEAMP